MRISTWYHAAAAVMPSLAAGASTTNGSAFSYTPRLQHPANLDKPPPTLSWAFDGRPTTFFYNNTEPMGTNWIGIWAAHVGEPVNGTKVLPPVRWTYASGMDDHAHVETASLPHDVAYRAYYMAGGSYASLAPPVDFTTNDPHDVHFLADDVWLRPVRRGQFWTQDLRGFLNVAGDPEHRHRLDYCNGNTQGWVRMTRDGVAYGIPGARAERQTECVVKVATRKGYNVKRATGFRFKVRVRDRDELPLVKEFRVMTWNLWLGGTYVDDYHRKQMKQIVEGRADVVALQEARGNHDALRLASALGWWAYETRETALISRYPIVEHLASPSGAAGVKIEVPGTPARRFVVWAVELSDADYGPFGLCFGQNRTVAEILAAEQASARVAQARALAATLAPYVAHSAVEPVFVAGGFNSPSHLDYTNATARRRKHCRASGAIAWPVTQMMAAAGLRDAYRQKHRDPGRREGITWSPMGPRQDGMDFGREGRFAWHHWRPQDRIDYVFYAAGEDGTGGEGDEELRLLDVTRTNRFRGLLQQWPLQRKNWFPSDHEVVNAVFKLGNSTRKN